MKVHYLSTFLTVSILCVAVGCGITLTDYYPSATLPGTNVTSVTTTIPTNTTHIQSSSLSNTFQSSETTHESSTQPLSSSTGTSTNTTSTTNTYIPSTDDDPPIISIITPQSGATTGSDFQMSGTVSDAHRLAYVMLQIDSEPFVPVQGDTFWSYLLTNLTPGNHTLLIQAEDIVGNIGTRSVNISVGVDNTVPNIAIANPVANGWMAPTWSITGTASDTGGLASIEVRIDTADFETATGLENWHYDVSGLTDGVHFITVRATDLSGNQEVTSIAVEVESNIPTVDFTYPKDGDHVGGIVAITGSSDDMGQAGVVAVQIRIDSGAWENCIGTDPWTYEWDTTTLSGTHTLEIVSEDAVMQTSTIQSIDVTITDWSQDGAYLNLGVHNANHSYITTDGNKPYVAFLEEISGVNQLYVRVFQDGYWQTVGTGSLNHDTMQQASHPALAYDQEQNLLYVVWEEKNGSGIWQVYGKMFEAGAWIDLGSLNNDPTRHARYPDIGIRTGTLAPAPYVVWAERSWYSASESNLYQLFAAYYTGATWQRVGNRINSDWDSNYCAGSVRIAFMNNMPYVCFLQSHYRNTTNYDAHVYYYSAENWWRLSPSSGLESSNQAREMDLVTDDTNDYVYVTYNEVIGADIHTFVRKWDGAWSGTLGGLPLNDQTTENARYPVIELVNNQPYVSWYEAAAGITYVYVKHWNEGMGMWDFANVVAGQGLNHNSSANAYHPEVISMGNSLYVSFTDESGATKQIFVTKYTL
jgi:hypothetical protein